ncbi:MAG: MBL fold metallo-hydrolase [Bacteroidota bacterium]
MLKTMTLGLPQRKYLLIACFLLITNTPIHAGKNKQIFKNPVGSLKRKRSPKGNVAFIARRILGVGNSNNRKIMKAYTLDSATARKVFLQQQTTNTITWIGHATFFLKIEQTHILTDPFFTNTAGKWGFGPRRYKQPSINIADLPQLDIILCSHNHYDHLDIKSLKRIKKKFGSRVQIFCPLGLKKYFQQCGFTKIQEMQWHDKIDHHEVAIHCLPAVHHSGRSLFDKNKTLWCGFGIKSNVGNIYFSGDTAYHPTVFKNMKTSLGSYDLAIVGIGAYKPQELLAQYHTNPEEAIQIALDVGAKDIIGMHWGTLNLSDEPADEPIKRLKKAAQKYNFGPSAVWLMKLGETRPLKKKT